MSKPKSKTTDTNIPAPTPSPQTSSQDPGALDPTLAHKDPPPAPLPTQLPPPPTPAPTGDAAIPKPENKSADPKDGRNKEMEALITSLRSNKGITDAQFAAVILALQGGKMIEVSMSQAAAQDAAIQQELAKTLSPMTLEPPEWTVQMTYVPASKLFCRVTDKIPKCYAYAKHAIDGAFSDKIQYLGADNTQRLTNSTLELTKSGTAYIVAYLKVSGVAGIEYEVDPYTHSAPSTESIVSVIEYEGAKIDVVSDPVLLSEKLTAAIAIYLAGNTILQTPDLLMVDNIPHTGVGAIDDLAGRFIETDPFVDLRFSSYRTQNTYMAEQIEEIYQERFNGRLGRGETILASASSKFAERLTCTADQFMATLMNATAKRVLTRHTDPDRLANMVKPLLFKGATIERDVTRVRTGMLIEPIDPNLGDLIAIGDILFDGRANSTLQTLHDWRQRIVIATETDGMDALATFLTEDAGGPLIQSFVARVKTASLETAKWVKTLELAPPLEHHYLKSIVPGDSYAEAPIILYEMLLIRALYPVFSESNMPQICNVVMNAVNLISPTEYNRFVEQFGLSNHIANSFAMPTRGLWASRTLIPSILLVTQQELPVGQFPYLSTLWPLLRPNGVWELDNVREAEYPRLTDQPGHYYASPVNNSRDHDSALLMRLRMIHEACTHYARQLWTNTRAGALARAGTGAMMKLSLPVAYTGRRWCYEEAILDRMIGRSPFAYYGVNVAENRMQGAPYDIAIKTLVEQSGTRGIAGGVFKGDTINSNFVWAEVFFKDSRFEQRIGSLETREKHNVPISNPDPTPVIRELFSRGGDLRTLGLVLEIVKRMYLPRDDPEVTALWRRVRDLVRDQSKVSMITKLFKFLAKHLGLPEEDIANRFSEKGVRWFEDPRMVMRLGFCTQDGDIMSPDPAGMPARFANPVRLLDPEEFSNFEMCLDLVSNPDSLFVHEFKGVYLKRETNFVYAFNQSPNLEEYGRPIVFDVKEHFRIHRAGHRNVVYFTINGQEYAQPSDVPHLLLIVESFVGVNDGYKIWLSNAIVYGNLCVYKKNQKFRPQIKTEFNDSQVDQVALMKGVMFALENSILVLPFYDNTYVHDEHWAEPTTPSTQYVFPDPEAVINRNVVMGGIFSGGDPETEFIPPASTMFQDGVYAPTEPPVFGNGQRKCEALGVLNTFNSAVRFTKDADFTIPTVQFSPGTFIGE